MEDNLDGDNDDDCTNQSSVAALSTNESSELLSRDGVLTNESAALSQVPALVPVPHLMVTNSPLRDSSLQSLDPAPVYDLDSSLHNLSSSLILHHQPLAVSSSDLTQPLSNITVTTAPTEFSDLLDPSDSADICETSPKPSEAIDDAYDDEYDYVTVDCSVHALPSSFETLPAT